MMTRLEDRMSLRDTWANKNMFNAMLRTGKNGTQGQQNPDGRTYSCPSHHKNSKSEKWTAKDAIW